MTAERYRLFQPHPSVEWWPRRSESRASRRRHRKSVQSTATAGERLTIEGLRNFYIKHRLEHLPSGGNYMTVIRQDEIIDVHALVGREFDDALADATAKALEDAAEKLLQGTWPQADQAGVAAAVRELNARADQHPA